MVTNMKKLTSLLLAAVMLLLLAGCGSSGNSSGSSSTANQTASEKVLTFGCQMYDDGSVNTVSGESSGWNCATASVRACSSSTTPWR